VSMTICDVGPRDGLQNDANVLSPGVRAELVTRLSGTRLPPASSSGQGRTASGATVTIATSFGCPFEGEVPYKRVLELAERLVSASEAARLHRAPPGTSRRRTSSTCFTERASTRASTSVRSYRWRSGWKGCSIRSSPDRCKSFAISGLEITSPSLVQGSCRIQCEMSVMTMTITHPDLSLRARARVTLPADKLTLGGREWVSGVLGDREFLAPSACRF
jgi:hypothetical protein